MDTRSPMAAGCCTLRFSGCGFCIYKSATLISSTPSAIIRITHRINTDSRTSCVILLLLFTVAEKGAPSFVRYLSVAHHFLQLSVYYASASPSLPSRDEKSVTASPLESTLTNCDTRKSFRIRFYENCRVSLSRSPPLFTLCAKSDSQLFCSQRDPHSL